MKPLQGMNLGQKERQACLPLDQMGGVKPICYALFSSKIVQTIGFLFLFQLQSYFVACLYSVNNCDVNYY